MKRLLLILFLCLCLPVFAQLLPDDKPMFGMQLDTSNQLTDGLVLYIPFVEAGNLVDFSFSGNDSSSFVGSLTWAGEGLEFDGSTSHVTFPQTPKSESLTTIIRFKTTDTSVNQGLFRNLNGLASDGRIVVQMGIPATVQIQIKIGGTLRAITSAAEIVINEWVTVAATVKDGDQRWYINGVLSGTPQTFSGTIDQEAGTPLTLGIGFPATGWIFNGIMSDAKLYTRALSSNEIQALYLNRNQLIETTPIWMFLAPEAPGGGNLQQIINNRIGPAIFGGSVVK